MIEILDEMPVIITKDPNFAKMFTHGIRPGMVVQLPGDAILVDLPKTAGVEFKKDES